MTRRLSGVVQLFLGISALGVFGPAAVAAARTGPIAVPFSTTRSASDATSVAIGRWQRSIAARPASGAGCYDAAYPSLTWHATPCSVAPSWPLAPGAASNSAFLAGGPATAPSSGGTLTVGNGNDYTAVLAGKIKRAAGSFIDVTPGITETGQINDQGPQVANEFTLQINSQFFSGSPKCAKSANPAKCLAWEQFVYETDTNTVYMQYWLINYANPCPSGWWTYSSDCYTNSPATRFAAGPLTAAELSKVKFVGTATKGSTDTVSLSIGGTAYLASNSDAKVSLAAAWNTTEFDVFGDGGGGAANFGSGTTIEPVTKLAGTTTAAPKCVAGGYTGETNNLTLTGTPALSSTTAPTMGSAQTNGTTTTASCATAG